MRSTYFFSGEIYFWYVSRCGENEWIVTSKKEFDEDKDCPGRWLWKKSEGKACVSSSQFELEYNLYNISLIIKDI